MVDNPRWWISNGNIKWYQVRAAIHDGTLFGGPWMTVQDGGFPMVTASGIKSEKQYMWHTIWVLMGDK